MCNKNLSYVVKINIKNKLYKNSQTFSQLKHSDKIFPIKGYPKMYFIIII